MDIYVASMSWLLSVMLQWTLGCMSLFKLGFSSFPGICSEVELLDHMVILFLLFEEAYYIFHNDCMNLHFHQQYTKGLFSPCSSPTLVIFVFLIIDFLVWGNISLWFWFVLTCTFLDSRYNWDDSVCVSAWLISALFIVQSCVCFFGEKKCIQVLHPFFNQVTWEGFATKLYEFLIYFRYQTLIKHMPCKYFLPFHILPFHFVDDFLCCVELFI